MSFALNPLKTVRVIDPRVNFSNDRMYSVLTGGSQVSWKPFTTSSFSNSSMNFSAPPPNPSICIDPKVYISVPVELKFKANKINGDGVITAWNAGDRALNDGCDAFRAFPISSTCNTLSVRINNSQASINLSDIIPYILRYNTDINIKEYDYSVCPTMMDTYQSYVDAADSNRNPLDFYDDNSSQTTRGSFPLNNISNPAAVADEGELTAIVTATITEPIFLSPFLFGKGSEMRNGFIGVQTFDFQFNMGDLTRMWSHSRKESVRFNSIDVTINQPAMLFNYITPKLLEPIPRSLSYSYMNIDRFPTDNNVYRPSGSEFRMESNNIQIGTIPRRIYIFARRKNGSVPDTKNYTLDEMTDTFAAIKSVSINYNNQAGLLSGASQQQLYNISKKNGVNLSFPEWCGNSFNSTSDNTTAGIPSRFVTAGNGYERTGLCGSILCLEWGIDIGLDDLHAPGEIQNSQLQISATFANISPFNMQFTFYILIVSEGVWTVENLNSYSQIGVLSKEDILNAKADMSINFETSNSIYGGDFLSDIGNFGKKVLNGIKDTVGIAKDVAMIAGPMLGMGHNNGGVAVGGVQLGGSKYGGKMINRSELHNRLK